MLSMSELIDSALVCSRCGQPLSPDDLACPACGLFVHLAELHELSRQAQVMEAHDPRAAAQIWRECLALIPQDSPQTQMLSERIAMLEGGVLPVAAAGSPPRAEPAPWTWQGALLRTGGSMLVSILVYGYFINWEFAVGFVLLILVHEMGHVLAIRHYGIRAAPPLFLPFIGAVITVPRLRNAQEEAIVGIGGPVLGTVGSLVCFALYGLTHHEILLQLSFFGFFLNLFNLLPVPPLDGGRVTAAVSPWIWPVGLLALIALAVVIRTSPIMILVILFSLRRLWNTFRNRERFSSYYQIPRSASWAIGCAYLLLVGLLLGMFLYTQSLGAGWQ
jgi:Zn-dependent protease